MLKGGDQVGKRLVTFKTGEELDKVKDIVFDHRQNRVLGFLVDEGGWFSAARVLPFDKAQAIGPDAIVVGERDAISAADSQPALRDLPSGQTVLKGTKMMTSDGRDLGTMSDLYFDEETGRIEGYEVSGGIFADAYSGRSFVPAEHTLTLGEDVAFVPPETADLMEEQVGGIKGAAIAAGSRLQEVGSVAGEKLQDAGEKVRDSASAAATATSEAARGAARSTQKAVTGMAVDPAEQRRFVMGRSVDAEVTAPDGASIAKPGETVDAAIVDRAEAIGVLDRLYRATGGSAIDSVQGRMASQASAATVAEARGRRVQTPVLAENGSILAAPGMIVNDAVVARVQKAGRETELLESVGLSATDAAGQTAKRAAGSAGAHLQRAGEGATDAVKAGTAKAAAGISGAWNQMKEKVDHFQDGRERQRVDNVLGRPITRVLLDREDAIVLNVGELITNESVERAREAGMLEVLLDSVAKKGPELAADEFRADEPGDAALPERTQQESTPEPVQKTTRAEERPKIDAAPSQREAMVAREEPEPQTDRSPGDPEKGERIRGAFDGISTPQEKQS